MEKIHIFINTDPLSAKFQKNTQKIKKRVLNTVEICQRVWHNTSEMPYVPKKY